MTQWFHHCVNLTSQVTNLTLTRVDPVQYHLSFLSN